MEIYQICQCDFRMNINLNLRPISTYLPTEQNMINSLKSFFQQIFAVISIKAPSRALTAPPYFVMIKNMEVRVFLTFDQLILSKG